MQRVGRHFNIDPALRGGKPFDRVATDESKEIMGQQAAQVKVESSFRHWQPEVAVIQALAHAAIPQAQQQPRPQQA